MQELEQTLDSREVAEMVKKQHKELMRDIKRYIAQIVKGNEEYGGERKIAPSDFFRESTYQSEQNKELPCYCITKKGCEFIAHKLTGMKGTAFTAQYINKFHDMENALAEGMGMQQLQQLQEAVEKQGKMLEKIGRQVSDAAAGEGRRPWDLNERYRSEIRRMINTTDSEKALRMVYTLAKYAPQ